jgi:NhaA family Na+:H+ antiporter
MRRTKLSLREFLKNESTSGILILISAALGLLVANSPWSEIYFKTLKIDFSLGSGAFEVNLTILKVINYIFMTVFFFVIGLEIKRELTTGHLASFKRALMPLLAALGGIAIPALIYLAIAGREAPGGWGVPVATDIALAIGLLAMLGSVVPESLRSFLLGIAVIDDIVAILIVALVYSKGIQYSWLGMGFLIVLAVVLLQKIKISSVLAYLVMGILLWFAFYKTGVHPTLAGVILGLLTPNIPREAKEKKRKNSSNSDSVSVIEWLEHKLHPVSAFFCVPIFAFANTGVIINSESLSLASKSLIAWGIFLGLVVGKPVGILVTTIVAAKFKVADIPQGANKSLLTATGSAAGIGFTVAIFIAQLAFEDPALQEQAIIAVIFASVTSACISVAMFKLFGRNKGSKRLK